MEKKRTPYRDKFMAMFGIGNVPGTTVHCFYAAKMGEEYLHGA